jgi:hypothetical protein
MNGKTIRWRSIAIAVFLLVLIPLARTLCGQQVDKNPAAAIASVFETEKNGHTARLAIRTRPFRKEAHKIEVKGGGFLVDGQVAVGTDGGIPKIEIESMRLAFDGRTVTIADALFHDIFEPRFKEGSFAVRFGDDLASLFVFMAGGDGAGSYQVLWVFRLDGRHSRFSQPCSDCRFLDFEGGVLGWIAP